MTMRVMILEDEPPAMAQLVRAVRAYSDEVEIVAAVGSVREARSRLEAGLSPDLVVADIHLSDTSSLRLFEQVPVRCPVVFVTAYDAHLLEAFERGAIDYVLKPIETARLHAALDRYLRLRAHFLGRVQEVAGALRQASSGSRAPRPKERILARRGAEIVAVPAERIAWFVSEHKLTLAVERGGARHMVDETLGELEAVLDARRFFRMNRQYLANVDAVKSFRSVGKGRLGVLLEPRPDDEVVVSQERAGQFREWVEGRA